MANEGYRRGMVTGLLTGYAFGFLCAALASWFAG